MTDSKVATPKHMAEPRNMPTQCGSSAFTPGCASFSLFSYKVLFTYIKNRSKQKHQFLKHQFLKHPTNVFT